MGFIYLRKKNGDNYEQEDECILNDDHGVTNLTRSAAREDDYRYEENWQAQYDQVIEFEDFTPNFPIVDYGIG